jgi:flagellum-specific ATP synthase
MKLELEHYQEKVAAMDCMTYQGRVQRMSGSIVESHGPSVGVGELCEILPQEGEEGRGIRAEVVGFRDETTILMPLEKLNGIKAGDPVVSSSGDLKVNLGMKLLGRVLDGLGDPIDGGEDIACPHSAPIYNEAPPPMARGSIEEPLDTGVRAIDLPLTLGKGQRMGIFAGAGVGKSTLLAQIARNARADANVIAMVGERGREVREFIENTLGPRGLEKSVVVVATADMPPLLKVKAAFTSTTIAEYLRDRGLHVLYMMDSLTRVANSQREIGLAAGEPPTAQGYPPSVFSLIPELTERLGNSRNGSITGIYSVLVERDDFTEPVADAVRASLDGHIVLSRRLADRGHYPAIDILGSISRLHREVNGPEELQMTRKLRSIISTYRDAEDLIKIGAYNKGTSPAIDRAMELMQEINGFLQQERDESSSREEARGRMRAITERWDFC